MRNIILSFTAALPLLAALPLPRALEADFKQVVINRDTNDTLTYTGHLSARLPDHLKWVYRTPVPKTVCLDGDRAWVIEPELEQATLYRLDRALPLEAILRRAEKLSAHRYRAHYEGIDYAIEVDEHRRLRRLSWRDEMGNRVVVTFTHLQERTSSKALRCDIPDDYDIVDGRY